MPIMVPENFRLPDGSVLDAATREANRQRHAARRQALLDRVMGGQSGNAGDTNTPTETTSNVVPIALGVVGVGALIYFATR